MDDWDWGSLALPLAAGTVALLVSALATPVVRYLARRRGFVAQPQPDRWHQKPTALLGGVAIYLATVISLLCFSGWSREILLLAGGLTGTFVLGLVDDVVKLPPQQKLVGQIALASLVAAGGIVFRGLPLNILAVPLTVFWLVAITNAFNLLDNMDGLSAGIACVTGAVLAAIGVLDGYTLVAVAGAAVAGASLGFLLYNSHPASIFMGDAGSMSLGFFVGSLAVLGNHHGTSQNVLLTLVVPIAALGVPLFDTTLVSLLRPLYGRSISQGGRDHTSHRLVALGLTETQTVRVLYLISAVFGAYALSTRYMDILMSLAMLALLLVGLVLFGIYLGQVKVYREAVPRTANGHRITVIGGTIMNKVPLAEVLLDLVLIFIAYLGAYLLKFEGTLTGPFLSQFTVSLPFIIVLKLGTFLLADVYRMDWQYVGLPEVLSFGKASTISTILCAIAVAAVWRFEGFSRSVFVIDWLLFTWLVVGSRMSFRMLAHWIQTVAGAKDGRLLVVGTRDQGANVVRAIQQGVFGEYVPVGFVDVKAGARVHHVAGVAVLGGLTELPSLLDGLEVDGVVAALGSRTDLAAGIVAECSRRGLPCHEIAPLDTRRGGIIVPVPESLQKSPS